MFSIEIVYSGYNLFWYPEDPAGVYGKIVGLMMRLCNYIYSNNKSVLIDSGFL